jgi:hypothetical protein
MPSPQQAVAVSKKALWTGRIVSGLVVLLLVFDGVTKVMKEPHVLAAAAQLGFRASTIVEIGAILLVCTVIYVIPSTSILGAVLLTGYLGGAVVTNMHAGNPVLETLFPVIFGGLAWLGIYLREPRLRALLPLRSATNSAD